MKNLISKSFKKISDIGLFNYFSFVLRRDLKEKTFTAKWNVEFDSQKTIVEVQYKTGYHMSLLKAFAQFLTSQGDLYHSIFDIGRISLLSERGKKTHTFELWLGTNGAEKRFTFKWSLLARFPVVGWFDSVKIAPAWML